MNVRKAALGGVEVSVREANNPDGQIYRGDLTHEGSIVLISMRGTRDFGTSGLVSLRLQSRLPPNHRSLLGMWLAYDHDQRITAGVVVISRDEVSETTFLETVKNWYDAPRGALRLRGQPRPRPSRPA